MEDSQVEFGISQALEAAIKYVSLNEVIKDRHTLLNARLVCRVWRSLFSGNVTSVTLHTPRDIELAAHFLPGMAGRRLPWQCAEDSVAFPGLSTLRVMDSLCHELYTNAASRETLASLEKFDVLFVMTGWKPKHESKFHVIAGVATIIDLLLRGNEPVHFDVVSFVGCFGPGARLRKLIINNDGNLLPSVQSLEALSVLSSLRHLKVESLRIIKLSVLADCFHSCGALTQLTQLELSADRYGVLYGEFEALTDLVKNSAPQSLHSFETYLHLPGLATFERCCLLLSYTAGVCTTKECRAEVKIDALQNLASRVSLSLSRARQWNAAFVQLSLVVHYMIPKEKLLIDLTDVASLRELAVSFQYYDSGLGFAESDSAESNADTASDLDLGGGSDGGGHTDQALNSGGDNGGGRHIERGGDSAAGLPCVIGGVSHTERSTSTGDENGSASHTGCGANSGGDNGIGRHVDRGDDAAPEIATGIGSGDDKGAGTVIGSGSVGHGDGGASGEGGSGSGNHTGQDGNNGGGSGSGGCIDRGDIRAAGVDSHSSILRDQGDDKRASSSGGCDLKGVQNIDSSSSTDESFTTCGGPNFVCQPGVQMSAVKLMFGHDNQFVQDFVDLRYFVQKLPVMFPHLRHLELRTLDSDIWGIAERVAQLTRLTHLSLRLGLDDLTWFPPSRQFLPASLRELEIYVDNLKLVSLGSLQHLSQLVVETRTSRDNGSILDEYLVNLPLTVFSATECCVKDLAVLVNAFPQLHTLEILLHSSDISPLSSLRFLQNLGLSLPASDPSAAMELIGLESLTGLASLYVRYEYSADILSRIAALTQLRYLRYQIVAHDSEHIRCSCRDWLKQQLISMPNTNLDITINGSNV